MEEKKIEAVKAWSEPKSIIDIQVFLGFAIFYYRFIQRFCKIAAPLTPVLKTISIKLPLKATNYFGFLILEAKLAFFRLRQVFIKALIFYHFDRKRYIQIKTDTFGYAISGILSQLISKSSQ